MNLEDLVKSLPDVEQATVEIDISDVLLMEEGSVVFTFRDPLLPELFQMPSTVAKIKIQFPLWPQELLETVALVAICYVKAEGERQHPYITMAHLAKRLDQAFLEIPARLIAAFPHLQNLKKAAEEKKGDSPPSN